MEKRTLIIIEVIAIIIFGIICFSVGILTGGMIVLMPSELSSESPTESIIPASYVMSEELGINLAGFHNITNEREYFICITGYEEDGIVYLEGVDLESYRIGNHTSVTHPRCLKEEHIAKVHKHPSGNPLPSRTDVKNDFHKNEVGIVTNLIHYQSKAYNFRTIEKWYEGEMLVFNGTSLN